MAKAKTGTFKEQRADQIKTDLSRLQDVLPRLGEPSYRFDVGERIRYGSMEESIVEEVLSDGKIYVIRCTKRKTGTETGETVCYAVPWTQIRPLTEAVTALERNRDIRLSFSPYTIEGVLTRYYHFGVDMDPYYQRGYVWEQEDKELLIDSIFSNIRIGELVFAKRDYETCQSSGSLYEILDGKQRLDALRGYYENRYPYHGYYFNDLGARDRHVLLERTIPVADLIRPDEETILRCFLMLNRTGKRMDAAHLSSVEAMLQKLQEEKKKKEKQA